MDDRADTGAPSRLEAFVLLWRCVFRADRSLATKLIALVTVESLARISFAYWLKLLTAAMITGALPLAAWSAAGYGICLSFVGIGNLYRVNWGSLLQEKTAFVVDKILMEASGEVSTIAHHERPEFVAKMELVRENRVQLGDGVGALIRAIQIFWMLLIALLLLSSVGWWLLLLPVLVFPSLAATHISGQIRARGEDLSARALHAASSYYETSISPASAKELRLLGLGDEFRRRYAAAWQAYAASNDSADGRALVLNLAGLFTFALVFAGAIALVAWQAFHHPSPAAAGNLVLVLTLAAQINLLVGAAMLSAISIATTLAAYDRVAWLISNMTVDGKSPGSLPPERLQHGITFDGVSFSYPGTRKCAIKELSCVIPAGSIVAIVGENGAGKTTLIKLLCRFYRPTSGRILIDDRDLATFELASWRERISGAFQDFMRYEFTLSDAVGVGDLPRIDDSGAVRAALMLVGAERFAEDLPQGPQTQLGTTFRDGTSLSGGQWQSLALARAAMRIGPLVLFLDEPTASLDAATEHKVYSHHIDAAREAAARSGAVTFLVSHRFSTTPLVDLILVIENGVLREMGEHAQLLANGGRYAELYNLQAANYR